MKRRKTKFRLYYPAMARRWYPRARFAMRATAFPPKENGVFVC